MNNPYLQVLEAAAESRKTHYQREAEQTRAHFARHPECRRIITAMDADGYVTRAKGEIDIEARCRPDWFKSSMWKGTYYEADRPVEAGAEEVKQTIWLETKQGHAVDVHKFMRSYLGALIQANKSTSYPVNRRVNRDQVLKAIAPVI